MACAHPTMLKLRFAALQAPCSARPARRAPSGGRWWCPGTHSPEGRRCKPGPRCWSRCRSGRRSARSHRGSGRPAARAGGQPGPMGKVPITPQTVNRSEQETGPGQTSGDNQSGSNRSGSNRSGSNRSGSNLAGEAGRAGGLGAQRDGAGRALLDDRLIGERARKPAGAWRARALANHAERACGFGQRAGLAGGM